MEITHEIWKRHFPAENSGAHLFPEFEMRAKAVSGEVFRVPAAAEAREALIRLVDAVQARKAVVVESPLQEAAGITAALRSRGVTVYTEAADIAAHADTADIETLRDALRQMKIDTVKRIEEVADRFEAEATKRGVKVFRAKTGNDVKKYLVNLCKEKGVKRIVKSKSMASEEIELSKHMEAAGITITETDRGE